MASAALPHIQAITELALQFERINCDSAFADCIKWQTDHSDAVDECLDLFATWMCSEVCVEAWTSVTNLLHPPPVLGTAGDRIPKYCFFTHETIAHTHPWRLGARGGCVQWSRV
jgi:hypothetical protein